MSASDDNATWQQILTNLKLQMTEATFDTWLRDSQIADRQGDKITVVVKNAYAVDWLESRFRNLVLRTAASTIGRPVEISYIVSDDGQHQPTAEDDDPADPDIRPDCRIAIEIVNFNPLSAGFVQISNYACQYWQSYLAAVERENGALTTGVAFSLWYTLRSFPAAWMEAGRPQWPSIFTLADMVAVGNRHKILGRKEYGQKRKHNRIVGALEILENERIVWPRPIGTGRDTVYLFRVLDILPLLTPMQVAKLSPRLQERHAREIERCKLEYEQWQQLALPTLLKDQ